MSSAYWRVFCKVLPSLVVLMATPRCARSAPEKRPAEITFTIDTAQSHPISRFIYGMNFRHGNGYGENDRSLTTLNRLGGNRFTAFNWTTNESNCGNDCGQGFPNDLLFSDGLKFQLEVGGAIRRAADSTFANGKSGLIITVPIAGYVAADHGGNTAPLPVAKGHEAPANPGARFKPSLPKNPNGATAKPEADATAIYQDDFVKWVETNYPKSIQDPSKPIFFQLDNEPDLWGSTHAELRGKTGSGKEVLTGYKELVTRTVDYAAAVKGVAPQARIFSPPLSGWFGFWGLGRKARPSGYDWYIDYYLDGLRAAQEASGKRLVDVLSVHWYPEARNECQSSEKPCWSERITNDWQPQTPSVIEARVQAPRSLWDPTFVEKSWITQSVPRCDSSNCAIRLLPRLKESIAAHYPNTALAVTEYYFGRGGDISGAIAQADALGIFGREGVFAATLWPAAGVYAWNKPQGACGGDYSCATLAYRCIFSAFKAFLDYDGKGSGFGDTSLSAVTNDVAKTSVYASIDQGHPERLVMVAINKTTASQTARLAMKNTRAFSKAEVYRVTGEVGQCTNPKREGDLKLTGGGPTSITMPPMSVGVYVFKP